ncbi:MAG: glycerophosphodiester phosphodiesterase [Hyphomicrobiaceae bacterium]|nr:glycerophosphodiester phosphodiesterase [Hyphomicrobiaceae bacterium]MCC0024817.1 glycerophosphodiester phosphodiesterase [Hyphomicrobiaceae bacterium]
MRVFGRILLVLLVFAAAIYLFNASWFAPPPDDPQIRLIAHRGVHQTFSHDGLTNETCTAERIYPPVHDYLENTVASAQAAFELGADVVEFDIAPTSDGQLAVFHDWTIDCRTEGHGDVRDFALADLQALDIGFGYTADGGKSFPFRGKGTGLLPDIAGMFEGTVGGEFLINFKSNDAEEADLLAERLEENPDWLNRTWSAYGGQAPSDKINQLLPGLEAFGSKAARDCLVRYIALGWTGMMPESCHNTKIMVPLNFTWLIWGWPNRFLERARTAGSDVVLIGPVDLANAGTTGIDTPELLSEVSPAFDGYIWTNRIDLIGPLVKGTAPLT